MTSSIKQEVHNPLHCCQRKTKPRPQITSREHFVKFGHVVFEICEQTHRQTDRHADRNTSHPSRGGEASNKHYTIGHSKLQRICRSVNTTNVCLGRWAYLEHGQVRELSTRLSDLCRQNTCFTVTGVLRISEKGSSTPGVTPSEIPTLQFTRVTWLLNMNLSVSQLICKWPLCPFAFINK